MKDQIYVLQVLLSNIEGYGTDEQPITVNILKALIIETIKQLETTENSSNPY